MRCVIVEDDEISSNLLQFMIKQVGDLDLVETFTLPLQALEFLKTNPVDLIFLDVEMPGLNGLDLIKCLENPPLVILTTAHTGYALKAFESDAIDYLMKPVEMPRFLKALDKVRSRLEQSPKKTGTFERDYFFLKKNTVLNKVPVRSIEWIEALGDYVTIHTSDGNYTLHTTLKVIETKLPSERFLRIHRSFIIHLEHITTIDDHVVSIGNKTIPVGALYRDVFKQRLNLLF